MIFVTVGHQLPFDRLVRLVDDWAGAKQRRDVFAQVGETSYRPKNFEAVGAMPPAEFRRRLEQATGIVAHAGVGTILGALDLGKPLLVLPRLVKHGEVRSDHQIPTAKHFADRGWLLAAFSEEELTAKLDEVEAFRPTSAIPKQASPELLERIRRFVFEQ